jgi:hypothetical protein
VRNLSASEKPLTSVQRAEQRNVQGLILFNPIILDSPWEMASTQDQDIEKLLEEKAPLVMAKARPSTNILTAHEMTIQNNAQQTIESMKSSLKLLLARIQKFTSHTFHVFLRELIPNAKVGRSLLFTRIVEHRNQYLAITRVNKRVKPYSALDTLKFIEKSYVQTNENSIHIAWTAILLHTRELLQPLYQWQASFDPLTRKYEQSKTKGLSKGEFRKLKVLIAKQITDDEKVILAGLDPTFTIENIDKGDFLLRTFQKKLAENASRFQSKKYTPDSRILTYLRIRAQEFNVQPPSFMRNKRQPEKGKGSNKRQRSGTQNNRAVAHQTYVQEFVADSTPQATVPSGTSVGKGQHKGKGKSLTKRLRSHTPSSGSFTTGKGSHGKGSTSTPSKGKTPLPGKGKGDKGKGARQGPPSSNVSRLQCKFCQLHGHIEQHCRKRQAL